MTAVALRKESVDRNFDIIGKHIKNIVSLSARRAWIEMQSRRDSASSRESLSARRAWIEIAKLEQVRRSEAGRSPQGERG